ncbi:hypothetical protein X798_04218 [Onchocerca flexuosa]|uniref:Uncharacterized protein n=1 Tax=Onchocerca flexuosa TaxID=387005 RepID=A0A238BVS9_9BILA|nr:hypothetical protein X798_04218 [Onchocerca flexuosa]
MICLLGNVIICNAEAIKDNQDVSEANMEGFNTNAVSENTHPSMTQLKVPENIVPWVNAIDARIFKNIVPTEEITFRWNQCHLQSWRKWMLTVKWYSKPRNCQLHAECCDLLEPEAWCNLKLDEF